MIDTYFDTNVYGHLHRRQYGITDAHLAKLKTALEEKKLRIFASFPVIEETNVARLSSIDEANARLELIRELTVQDQLIKHHAAIIEGDILAYANNSAFPSKFEAPPPGLRSLFFDHTEKNYDELKTVAEETLKQILKFSEEMNNLFNEKVRPKAYEIKKHKAQQPFPDYWNTMSEPWVEQVAEHFGQLEKCKAKGIAGLLNVPSVMLNTIAQTSLTYANTYERKSFDKGNSRDMHHVVCASAAPIFVSHDKALHAVLARKPAPGLEIIDIHALLNRL